MSSPLPHHLPGGDSPARAAAKETIWRLSALAFGHPTEELFEAFASGGFHQAFDAAWSRVTGRPWRETEPPDSAAALESGFIRAFLHGPKGKPVASLLAGDYEALLAGHARPVFMLNIGAFYRHFGLKAARDDEGRNDEPDHMASMLEFMAVLAFLEGRALNDRKDPAPYRRAQRDFLRRYLGPLLEAIADRLRRSPVPDLAAVHTELVDALPRWAEGQAAELEARVGPYRDPDDPAHNAQPLGEGMADGKHIVDQNLWG